jgi:hypothetical protein
MNEALAWWALTRIMLPLCALVVALTLIDAVIEWWRGPK